MNIDLTTFSWDTAVLLAFLGGVGYAVFWGRNKIVGLLVNFYIALAVTVLTGELVYAMVANLGFVSSQLALSEFAVKTIMLVVLTALLSVKSEIAGLDSAGTVTKMTAGFYGFLAAGLLLATIFSFMSGAELLALDSNFVNIVNQYFEIWVLTPILYMIISAFIKR